MKKIDKIASIYSVLAGTCDGLTGIMLLVAPVFTLQLMGIKTVPTEPVYMQWIGAFVFSVGFSYFLPFISGNAEIKNRRMISVFEFTAFIRIVIVFFSGVSIARGNLDPAWIAVTLTDIILAAIQITFLKLGAFRD